MTVFNARATSTTAAVAAASSTTAGSMNEGSSRQPSNSPAAGGEISPAVVDDNVVFPVGSTVECRTALDTTLVGQVVCSDQPNRLLVIKDTSGAKPLLRFINLALVAQVTCLKDKAPGEQTPSYQNLQVSAKHVQDRMSRAEARKKASIMQADVPIEGQRAFIHLRKTLEHRVEWSGCNIKVLNRVLVRPPYTADSIEHIGDISDAAIASAKEHVRKILSKYRSTQQQSRSSCDDAPADPTPSR